MRALSRRGLLALAAMLALGALSGAPAAAGANVAGDGLRIAPDFTLTNQNGARFTLSHERGHPVVLFFGYAHCPDVCPTILANLKRALGTLGPAGAGVVVALVTVDPARDDGPALRRFLAAFDPSFVGLTGSKAALAPVYRAYHVRYAKQAGNAGDYLVSHTAFVYYIGPGGRIRAIGTWSDDQPVLEEDLKEIAVSKP